jgi:hypothetical protein
MAGKIALTRLVTCKVCGTVVVLEDEDVDCSGCGVSYNKYGKRVDVPDGYPLSYYHEDKQYVESGRDNVADLSNDELEELGWQS